MYKDFSVCYMGKILKYIFDSLLPNRFSSNFSLILNSDDNTLYKKKKNKKNLVDSKN